MYTGYVSFVGVGQILCPSFPLGIEDGMWDVIVLIPDRCLSIYFTIMLEDYKEADIK